MPAIPQEKPAFSEEEINQALADLSEADWLRLGKISRRFSLGRIDPDDLLQRAFVALLSGARKWPCDITLMCFMVGTIKSLASSQFKSLNNSPELHLVGAAEDDLEEDLLETTMPDPAPNAELSLISEQETKAICKAVLHLFEDDEIAQVILEGHMDDMSAADLRELTGLDQTAYNSKKRLIRRRIDSAFPEGWKR
ncbi:MAG: hypothetical protein AB7F61_18725 [Desulfobulbus sp.]|jgi:RNA polymerase sigma-70 factor (ECF subfamily)